MFVLDFVPEEYLGGGAKDSVVVFTAGWAMKFVPLLGKALAEMALHGRSEYAREEFAINRKDPKTGNSIIVEEKQNFVMSKSVATFKQQASGSSMRKVHSTTS